MSYTLEFLGPALRCNHADDGVIHEVNRSYARLTEKTTVKTTYHYVSWVPEIGQNRTDISFIRDKADNSQTIDLDSSDAAHLYVIPNTSTSAFSRAGALNGSDDTHYGYQDLLDCKLYNVSYQAFFNLHFPHSKSM